MPATPLPSLNLIELSNHSIYAQLQLEEALLRADESNWCLINRGSPPAIVMGISGEGDAFVNRQTLQKAPIPIIKRFSGGGTVIVDENTLFITLICNSKETKVSCCPEKVLQWTEELYRPIFPQGFRVRENDYVIGEHKFGGNAQYFRKERWLHHSSILWDFTQEKMDYLLHPKKQPKYREGRHHLDFLCKLCNHDKTLEKIHQELIASLSSYFQVNRRSLKEAEEVLTRPHRKSTILMCPLSPQLPPNLA